MEWCIKCSIRVTIAGIQGMMSHTKTNTPIQELVVVFQLSIHVGLAIGKKALKRNMPMQNGCRKTHTKCVPAYLIPTRTDDLSYVVL